MRTAVMVAMVVAIACRRAPRTPCQQAFDRGDYPGAIERCAAEVGDVHAAALLAQAHLQLRDFDAAARVAGGLVDGPEARAAQRVLGKVAFYRAHELTNALWRDGRWQAALDAADLALLIAQAVGVRSYQRTAQLARTVALRRMGETRRAEDALALARALSDDACDHAFVDLQLGTLRADAQQPALARAAFEDALAVPAGCTELDPETVAVHLAWLEYFEGEHDRATQLLDGVAETFETLLIRARIVANRGDLDGATRDLARTAAMTAPDGDWQWEVELLRAQLDEARGDPVAAERAYRRSIAEIAALRARSPSGDAFSVSLHRAPYDGLIALLADQRRWRDAMAIVLELDASDMLRSTAAPTRSRDPVVVGGTVASSSGPPTVDAVADAWRGRELVIVVATTAREIKPGGERVYRLRVSDGRVDGAAVGDAAQARRWASKLFADPRDVAAARGLGDLVVPPDPTDRALHVLLLGTLGQVPLAALRDDHGLVVARRPLARVLSLRPRPPRTRVTTPAVVLADPEGNLPAAAVEGAAVAKLLGVTSFVQAEATSARLWSALHADVLHLAAHVDDGRALHLADRAITPDEIVERGLAPRIAVIAACGSKAAHDEEGWGSLAQALLAAGSDTVIASDRSVPDRDVLALMQSFYAAPDWRDDPARALARAQMALAHDPDAEAWAAFSALAAPP